MVIQESISAENTKEKKVTQKIERLNVHWGRESPRRKKKKKNDRQTDRQIQYGGSRLRRQICRENLLIDGPIDPRLRFIRIKKKKVKKSCVDPPVFKTSYEVFVAR